MTKKPTTKLKTKNYIKEIKVILDIIKEGIKQYKWYITGVILLIAVCALIGTTFMYCTWNYAIVPLFAAPEITFFQSFLLNLLVSFICSGTNRGK